MFEPQEPREERQRLASPCRYQKQCVIRSIIEVTIGVRRAVLPFDTAWRNAHKSVIISRVNSERYRMTYSKGIKAHFLEGKIRPITAIFELVPYGIKAREGDYLWC